MPIRLRIPELLDKHKWTAYRLSREAGKDDKGNPRLSLSTAYRLTQTRGALGSYPARMLDVLCDVLKVTPGELIERTPGRADAQGRKRKRA